MRERPRARTAPARATAVPGLRGPLELLRRVAFPRSDLLAADDLFGSRAVRVGAALRREIAADRRRDDEVLAWTRALVARNDHAGIRLLNGLMIALAEVRAALLVGVVVVVLER